MTVDERRATGRPRSAVRSGPYDEDQPGRSDRVARTDFGALLLPVPTGGVVNVEPSAKGKLQAVHIMLSAGRLSVSALAAPTSGRLWPELAKEINTSLRDGGARVRSFQGPWGRELRARTGEAMSVFVGIDGPRWMVYGVATGPAGQARDLDRELRRVLGETVVVRGAAPYPVRTVLPLVLPEDLQAEQAARAAQAVAAPAALTVQEPEAEPEHVPAGAAAPQVPPATAEEAPAGTAALEATPAPGAPAGVVAEPLDPPTVEFPAVPPARQSEPPPPPVEYPTEIIAPVRADGGVAWDATVEATGPVPAVCSVADAPALAYLLADPMDLFTARPPGRHRRGD